MADEELRCFGYLRLNISTWTHDLDTLSQSIKDWQESLVSETTSAQQTINKTKNDAYEASLCASVHSRTSVGAVNGKPGNSNKTARSSFVRTLRLTLPRRSTRSLWSSRGSDPPILPRLNTGVLYYDSGLQKRFEALVRDINIGRSHIRKAITQARAGRSRLMDDVQSNLPSRSDSVTSGPNIPLQSCKTRNIPLLKNSVGDRQILSDLDGLLDRSQTLCERAAYRLLRDGDCTSELESVKREFEKLKEDVEMFTSTTIGPVQVEKEEAQSERTPVIATKVLPTVYAAHISSSTLAALEADDDDEEEDEDEKLDVRALSHRLASSQRSIAI